MRTIVSLFFAGLLLPICGSSHADDKKSPSYDFEFKIAKQREARSKKGSSSNNSTAEKWCYKVEVENLHKKIKSLAEETVKMKSVKEERMLELNKVQLENHTLLAQVAKLKEVKQSLVAKATAPAS